MRSPDSRESFLGEGRAIEDYFTEKGLRAHLGLPSNLWNYAIFKEILDNSLDSIEFFPEKQIQIETSNPGLWISDQGPGLTLEAITAIYNFYGYFSSKRWTRAIHRGSLGNALKSIIGLCYIKKYPLEWRLKSGVAIRCLLNEVQKNRGVLFFETRQRKYEGPWGIYVEGFQIDFDLSEKLSGFSWANPDVTFLLNKTTRYEAFSKPLKRKRKAFLHWYDWDSFYLLANRHCRLAPKKTTRAFLKEFYGASQIHVFPTPPPVLLQECVDHSEELQKIYFFLREQIPPPSLSLLKTFVATRKECLAKLKVLAYKEKSGTSLSKEAFIPFLLQGMLLKTEAPNRVLTTVNGSVPYQDFPLLFPETDVCFMGYEEKTARRKTYLYKGYHSLKETLHHLHFFKGQGYLLLVNVISPFIEFSDAAKTQINATGFQKELETLVEHLATPVLNDIRREELGVIWGGLSEKGYKKELMHRHFLEAFERSSGGYSVFIRQVFYKLHEILNHRYGLDLNASDYHYLTQTLATQMLEQETQVAQRLLFSVRGYFHHSFYDFDLPLGTKEIRDYASLSHQNKLTVSHSTQFDFEDRYLLKNILFIEKAGFNILLEESGLTQELNLSILSTQGNNTRAGAMLLHYFQEQNLHLYSLTDYDFAGLKIHNSMSTESPTYPSIASIARIGLSLEEIQAMKLMPEVVTYKKEYRNSPFFKRLPSADQSFFTKEDTLGLRKFQRVELNALSNQQLIDLLRKKISEKKVVPPDEIILNAFELNEIELQKTALYEKLGFLFKDWKEPIHKEEVLHRVKSSTSHWLESLPQAKAEYEKYLIQKFCQKLENFDLISFLKKQQNSES